MGEPEGEEDADDEKDIPVEAKLFCCRRSKGMFVLKELHKRWERVLVLSEDQLKWIGENLSARSKAGVGVLQRKVSKRFVQGIVVATEGSNMWGAFLSIQIRHRLEDQSYMIFPAGKEGCQWSRVAHWFSNIVLEGDNVAKNSMNMGEQLQSRGPCPAINSFSVMPPLPNQGRSFADVVRANKMGSDSDVHFRELERVLVELSSKLDLLVKDAHSSSAYPLEIGGEKGPDLVFECESREVEMMDSFYTFEVIPSHRQPLTLEELSGQSEHSDGSESREEVWSLCSGCRSTDKVGTGGDLVSSMNSPSNRFGGEDDVRNIFEFQNACSAVTCLTARNNTSDMFLEVKDLHRTAVLAGDVTCHELSTSTGMEKLKDTGLPGVVSKGPGLRVAGTCFDSSPVVENELSAGLSLNTVSGSFIGQPVADPHVCVADKAVFYFRNGKWRQKKSSLFFPENKVLSVAGVRTCQAHGADFLSHKVHELPVANVTADLHMPDPLQLLYQPQNTNDTSLTEPRDQEQFNIVDQQVFADPRESRESSERAAAGSGQLAVEFYGSNSPSGVLSHDVFKEARDQHIHADEITRSDSDPKAYNSSQSTPSVYRTVAEASQYFPPARHSAADTSAAEVLIEETAVTLSINSRTRGEKYNGCGVSAVGVGNNFQNIVGDSCDNNSFANFISNNGQVSGTLLDKIQVSHVPNGDRLSARNSGSATYPTVPATVTATIPATVPATVPASFQASFPATVPASFPANFPESHYHGLPQRNPVGKPWTISDKVSASEESARPTDVGAEEFSTTEGDGGVTLTVMPEIKSLLEEGAADGATPREGLIGFFAPSDCGNSELVNIRGSPTVVDGGGSESSKPVLVGFASTIPLGCESFSPVRFSRFLDKRGGETGGRAGTVSVGSEAREERSLGVASRSKEECFELLTAGVCFGGQVTFREMARERTNAELMPTTIETQAWEKENIITAMEPGVSNSPELSQPPDTIAAFQGPPTLTLGSDTILLGVDIDMQGSSSVSSRLSIKSESAEGGRRVKKKGKCPKGPMAATKDTASCRRKTVEELVEELGAEEPTALWIEQFLALIGPENADKLYAILRK